jgi:ATP/maltotriose-dependent transcriptional regulator MalT
VHRAEFLQLQGAWAEAEVQADEACVSLTRFGFAAAGPAHYRVGELARLRGDLTEAERAFGRAAACGHEVQPGLARVRVAQGRPTEALAGLDRALAEQRDPRALPELLCARVEVCLAGGDVAQARVTLDRMASLVPAGAPPFLRAMCDLAHGAVLGAEGRWEESLPRLRRAWSTWTELGARYDAALAQLALGRACDGMGDTDAAAMETAAATRTLGELGATVPPTPPMPPMPGMCTPSPSQPVPEALAPRRPDDCPLSPRELDVLRVLATGATNRAIASSLVLSEKTVARHVSNIFAKLGVSSRSAATARAFERHWT